ncbi:hypothetical protein E2P81_ATG09874 [Venturia nashicola]|uniref:Uncharacterized protein n=1 Tax=Venturia nashicola TaxID=86259 RepID=A0A4Z1NWU0_9PEZI|nr:hypothetical protein E6O75_ATG10091 [Venturia nashicola]TLD15026.1 hypothetical protein E2P81_ATG09874 [Venturia nashicola]
MLPTTHNSVPRWHYSDTGITMSAATLRTPTLHNLTSTPHFFNSTTLHHSSVMAYNHNVTPTRNTLSPTSIGGTHK